ncbi:DUF4913 domain-containing protein [Nocardia sp. NBC_01503]|uniref:DUF4913 domain-containing protein n=1 Tax=Nocardia sp. NBC_01503 TaxID=2975997 RepID=UPI002E7B9F76|nr:DUF4913 domain-containing protein [Nocardia sp. NBC_01503]WTL31175.1 DUF4913 domain-containing protein [Nocardia sp. NBC_01503]
MTDGGAQTYVYVSAVEFVENYLSLVYRRDVTENRTRVWCRDWWMHAEAIARLDAIWRAWEHLRRDSHTGLSVWFLDHADPHMRELFDPEGPFKFCSPVTGHSNQLTPLPLKSPPKDIFGSAD